VNKLYPDEPRQLTRLQQVVAVAGVIERFGFLLSHQPNVSQTQHDAVKDDDNRLVVQGKIQAEHQRLQNLLG